MICMIAINLANTINRVKTKDNRIKERYFLMYIVF